MHSKVSTLFFKWYIQVEKAHTSQPYGIPPRRYPPLQELFLHLQPDPDRRATQAEVVEYR
jgi:hypothetical protein